MNTMTHPYLTVVFIAVAIEDTAPVVEYETHRATTRHVQLIQSPDNEAINTAIQPERHHRLP